MFAAAAMMEVDVLKDKKLVVSLVVHYATLSTPNKWCNQTVGQVALLRQGSGASSAPLTASGRGDGLENEGIRQQRSINRSPFNSRVDKIGLQSRMISQPRCRPNRRKVKAEMVVFSCLLAGMISSSVIKLHVCLHVEW